MTKFKVDDRVEMIEDANNRSTGDQGTVTNVEVAEEEWGGQFLQIKWEGTTGSDGCYSKRLKKVEEPRFQSRYTDENFEEGEIVLAKPGTKCEVFPNDRDRQLEPWEALRVTSETSQNDTNLNARRVSEAPYDGPLFCLTVTDLVRPEDAPVAVGQVRAWTDGTPEGSEFHFVITNVTDTRAEYHYLEEDYLHDRDLKTGFQDSKVVGYEAQDKPSEVTEEVASVEEVKPEREHLGGIHYTNLRDGDTITFTAGQYFSIYRDKEPEPEVVEPVKPATGTRGTALVDGERIPGMIDEDGDFKYLHFDGDYVDDIYATWSDRLEFEPED